MNDEFSDLENDLRRLEPVKASEQLEQNIAALLEPTEPQPAPAHWWQSLGFNRPLAAFGWTVVSPALTAVVMLVVLHSYGSGLPPRSPTPRQTSIVGGAARDRSGLPAAAAPMAGFEPPVASNVVYQARDEGIVLDGKREPVRRLRYLSADFLEWSNPQTGSHWEISFPREDVLLVPIKAE